MQDIPCSTEGCRERSLDGRGLCAGHLTGALLAKGKRRAVKTRKKTPPRVRRATGLKWLRAHVDREDGNCLLFPCGNHPATGSVTLYGQRMAATRAMCRLAHGLPPEDKTWALHRCGNGHLGCVHPKHLYWGDASDNAKDAHGHQRVGKELVFDRRPKAFTSAQARKTRLVLIAAHNEQQTA